MFHVDDRTTGAAPGTEPGGAGPVPDRLTRGMDGLLDAAVVAFALWTLVYHLGLLVKPPTWLLVVAWLAVSAVVGALYVRRPWDSSARWRDSPARPAPLPRAVPVIAVAAGIGAGVSAGLYESGLPWWCTALLGVVSVSATGYAVWRGRLASPGDPARPADGAGEGPAGPGDAPVTRWGSPVALATGAGFAVASLFLVNTDGDDTYFVSRSVATAMTGRIPFQDVVFTPESVGPIAGEPPVSSYEVLAGSLARLLGVHASSLLWYVLLPAATFLAVWAMWRLVRAWAPRRAVACFGVAAVYLLWSGPGAAALGSFHLLRMWQGKAVLVSLLIPLLYLYLTRWAERPSRAGLIMLAATGVTAVGLTSSAAFIVPLAVAAAVLPLLATRRFRAGLGACAALAYPIAAGLAVMLLHEKISVRGGIQDAGTSYLWILLGGVLGTIAGVALWTSPWTVRRGVPALIAAGTALMATVLFVPGVLEIMAGATGAGQVLWRTLWVVPAPVLIGLLATLPVPALVRGPGRIAAAALPAAALVTATVLTGTPLWSATSGTTVSPRPAWKLEKEQLTTANAVVRAAGRSGMVLMPQPFMRVVPMVTTRVQAVNPNTHYLEMLPAPRAAIEDRKLLTDLAGPSRGTEPSAGAVREALRHVGVTVACVWPGDKGALKMLRKAGYGGRARIGRLVCLFPGRS